MRIPLPLLLPLNQTQQAREKLRPTDLIIQRSKISPLRIHPASKAYSQRCLADIARNQLIIAHIRAQDLPRTVHSEVRAPVG